MEINRLTYNSLDILLHILILFTFLSVLFFAFISKVEEKAFKNEIGNLIEDNINQVLNKERIKSAIAEAKPILQYLEKEYSSPEDKTLRQNKMIKFLSAFTSVFFLSIFLTIAMTAIFECKHSVPFGRLILKNIIIFIFVGAIEYIFFTNIAMKYIPSPPTLLVKTLITALQKRFQ